MKIDKIDELKYVAMRLHIEDGVPYECMDITRDYDAYSATPKDPKLTIESNLNHICNFNPNHVHKYFREIHSNNICYNKMYMTPNAYTNMVNYLQDSGLLDDNKSMEIYCSHIKDVIFNDPATIVFWEDGTKTVVKCNEDDIYDPEKGLAMAILKHIFGSTYYKMMKEWTKNYIEEPIVDLDTNIFSAENVKKAFEKFKACSDNYTLKGEPTIDFGTGPKKCDSINIVSIDKSPKEESNE